MSGKVKKATGWGGKRANQTGRPPKYMLTDYQIEQMHKKAKKYAKEQGKTIDEILLDIIYFTGRTETREKLAAIKLFKDYTMQKSTEKDVNINVNQGPVIGLPEVRPDPAKEIQTEKVH